MVINQLYPRYFQKSKLFLYPLLGLQRGLTAPEEVYFSWEGKYSPEDQKLILVYTNVSGSLYQELKNTKLANHRLLLEIIPTMGDQEIYVFDFSSYATAWDHLIAGRYSKMSLKTKQTILDYFERYSGNYIYMHSFLFPNKWFKRYAEILDVPEELLIEVGELCDKPDWKKELFTIHDFFLEYSNIEPETSEYVPTPSCDRCNDQGVIPKYSHISNGVCFKCYGRKKKEQKRTAERQGKV
jgi:hypothetical protein